MSDTLNALRGASVLDAIAHPQVANPLAAIAQSNQAAEQGWRIRQDQAQQAAGQAFLASIDPATGQPSSARLNQNLAANPATALAAQAAAQSGITLDKDTLAYHIAQLTGLNNAAMTLTAQHPGGVPADVMHAAIDRVGPEFDLSPAQIAQAHSNVSDDPAANTRRIFQNATATMSTLDALHAVRPGMATVDTGQGIQGVQIGAPLSSTPGALTPVGGQVDTGFPSRTDLLKQVDQPADAATAKLLNVPVGTTVTLPMILRYNQQGLPPSLVGRAGSPGGGGQAAPPPTPPRIPGTGAYTPRRTATPAPAPTPTTGAPAPAPATAAPTPSPAPAPAAATPATGIRPVATSLVPGAGADVDQFKKEQAEQPQVRISEQNLVNALNALRLTTTGKTQEATHAMYSLLQSHGMLPAGMTDDVKNFEIFRKDTERYVLAQAAGTDAGREMAAQANAGTSLSTPANIEVLRNDIGRLRQRQAAYQAEITDHANDSGIGFPLRRGGVVSGTDLRGFLWNDYSQAEQAAINKSIANDPAAQTRLHRAVGMAKAFQLEHGPER